jgi:hypothetical protein
MYPPYHNSNSNSNSNSSSATSYTNSYGGVTPAAGGGNGHGGSGFVGGTVGGNNHPSSNLPGTTGASTVSTDESAELMQVFFISVFFFQILFSLDKLVVCMSRNSCGSASKCKSEKPKT